MRILLGAYARRVLGKHLCELSRQELYNLVTMIMPSSGLVVERIYEWSDRKQEEPA